MKNPMGGSSAVKDSLQSDKSFLNNGLSHSAGTFWPSHPTS